MAAQRLRNPTPTIYPCRHLSRFRIYPNITSLLVASVTKTIRIALHNSTPWMPRFRHSVRRHSLIRARSLGRSPRLFFLCADPCLASAAPAAASNDNASRPKVTFPRNPLLFPEPIYTGRKKKRQVLIQSHSRAASARTKRPSATSACSSPTPRTPRPTASRLSRSTRAACSVSDTRFRTRRK